jgi:putative ABC transport system permease protein
LGIVAALTPLFLSSASSASLQQELEGRCAASFGGQTINFASNDVSRQVLTDATAQDPAFLPPRLYLEGALVTASNSSGDGLTIPIRFTGRDGFRDHIEVIEGTDGPGAYIDDVIARDLLAGPGDTIQYFIQGDLYEFQVQAVYKNLSDQITSPYWCFLENVLTVTNQGDPQPSLVLVDTDYFSEGSELYGRVFAEYGRGIGTWELPVKVDGLTVPGAIMASSTLEEAQEIVHDLNENPSFFQGPSIISDLPLVTTRVEALTEALRSSIIPLAAVVLLAAIALVGGAGSYWIERRKLELQHLSMLGAGPGLIALKAVLEFLPAMLIGGSLGWLLANLLIPWAGPSADIDPSARVAAVWVVAGAIALSLLAVAAIVAMRARGLLDHKPRSQVSLAWRIPALIIAIIGAVLVRIEIGDSAVITSENQLVGSVDPMVLFLPFFTIIAAVLLVSELIIRLFPLIRRLGAKGHSLYLASRRIVSAPTLVIALVAGAALPVATLIYAASLTRSATSTIDAKGRTFIGADVATPIFELIDPPGSLAEASTVVIKSERVALDGTEVDVLAIDYETFERGAFYEEEYADVPLQTILDGVHGDNDGAPLDAYIANGSLGSGDLTARGISVPVRVVGEVETFPGTRRSRPLVIVDRERYFDLFADENDRLLGSRYLMWTMGRTPDEIESELQKASIGFAFTTAATSTLDQLRFKALVWTFDFLEIYSALAGLIAIGAVLLYVDTRQRARNLSYALARRMGLTRREHMLAGLIEIGSLTLLGIATGLVAGRIPARQLFSILDAVSETPPPPRWVGAADLALITFLIGLVVSIIATILAQKTADGADTSELLRHGE